MVVAGNYAHVNLSVLFFGALIVFALLAGSDGGSYCAKKADSYDINRITSIPQCVTAKSVDSLATEGPNRKGFIKASSSYLSNNKTLPSWFDPELARIGQKFGRKNAAGIYYSIIVYIIFIFSDTDTRRVVVDTQKSVTPETAFKRYLTNFVQIQLWFDKDFRHDYTDLYESLDSVRYIHQAVLQRTITHSERMSKRLIPEPKNGENPGGLDMRIWKAFQQDLEASRFAAFKKPASDRYKGSKIKFNQYSLAVAHFLQFGVAMAPEKFLIYDATDEELMGYLHLWAFIGNAASGVEDDYNVCLQPDATSAKAYFRKLLEEHYVPTLFDMDYEAKYMYEIVLKGLNNAFAKTENLKRINGPNSLDFFLLRLTEDILEIPSPHIRAVLTTRERLATEAFKVFAHPDNYPKNRELTNGIARRFLGAWTMQKFGIDTRNTSDVAKRLFV